MPRTSASRELLTAFTRVETKVDSLVGRFEASEKARQDASVAHAERFARLEVGMARAQQGPVAGLVRETAGALGTVAGKAAATILAAGIAAGAVGIKACTSSPVEVAGAAAHAAGPGE